MDNVLHFSPRPRPAAAPPAMAVPRSDYRARLEEVAQAALDFAERIMSELDRMDGDPDREDGGDAEPDLGAPEEHGNQIVWFRGTTRDLEQDHQQEHTR